MFRIDVINEHPTYPADAARLRSAVEQVLRDAGLRRATISIAIVDDAKIHQLNRRFLGHDYPTDVISFVLERDENSLDGEVVASADTAAAVAARLRWPVADELLLYVVHGALHLVGYDDNLPSLQAQMRQRERDVLLALGVKAKYEQ